MQVEVTLGGLLRAQLDSATHEPINVYRCFPLSAAEHYICLRQADGTELGIIRDLADLADATAATLREELDQRYFTPEITSVRTIKEEFGYSYWEVDTPVGQHRFTVQSGKNNIMELGGGELLLLDVDGNRFRLADYQQQPVATLKTIETMLSAPPNCR